MVNLLSLCSVFGIWFNVVYNLIFGSYIPDPLINCQAERICRETRIVTLIYSGVGLGNGWSDDLTGTINGVSRHLAGGEI